MKIKQLFLALALVAVATPAFAGKYAVRPLGATLAPNQKITTFTVRNLDTEPLKLQMQGYTWTQDDKGSHQEATSEIKFGPSVVTILPGKEQVIRIGRTVEFKGSEMAYRVQLSELPQPKQAKEGDNTAKVIIPISYNVPLFYRDPAATPKLATQWVKDGLQITNTGNATAQVSMATAKGYGLLGYVLPGKTQVFKAEKAQGPLKLRINGTEQEF